MLDDLGRAELPEDVISAVGKVDHDVLSSADLQAVIQACLVLKDRIAAGRSATVAVSSETGTTVAHTHPLGFRFNYPSGWTAENDTKNKTTLLLPPGVTLQTPGQKAIYLVRATPLQTTPFGLRSYFEKEFAGARIASYRADQLESTVGQAGIMTWDIELPPPNGQSSFRAYVVIMRKNWAVHIDAFGPLAASAVYDEKVRAMVESLTWQ